MGSSQIVVHLLILALPTLVLCKSAVPIANFHQDEPLTQSELLHQAGVIVHPDHPILYRPNNGLEQEGPSLCHCNNYTCGCCLFIAVEETSLRTYGCLNITKQEDGFVVALDFSGFNIVKKTVSGKKSPPLCGVIPYLKNYSQACVDLRNLEATKDKFSGCASIEIRSHGGVLKDYNVGCFRMPPDNKLLEKAAVAEPTKNFEGQHLKDNSLCTCKGFKCGCCLRVDVPLIHLHAYGCANVTYFEEEGVIEGTLDFNGITIVDRNVSVKDPPPVCADIPYLTKQAKACIKFRDIDYNKHRLSACASLDIEFEGKVIGEYDLGCFHIPPDRNNLLENVTLEKPTEDIADLQGNSICSCQDFTCACCLHLKVLKIDLHTYGCMNVTYIREAGVVEGTLEFNGHTFVDRNISVRNLPAVCARIPFLKKKAYACIKLHDLDYDKHRLSACASIGIKYKEKYIRDFNLGCFHISPKRNNLLTNGAVAEPTKDVAVVEPTELQLKDNSLCTCKNFTCGCCLHLDVQTIGLHAYGCMNVTYFEEEGVIEGILDFNGITIIDRNVSVKDPPPVCANIPYLTKQAKACIKFRDIDYNKHRLSACASIDIEFEGKVIGEYDLGCFHIPPDRNNWLGEAAMTKLTRTGKELMSVANKLCTCKGYKCGCCLHLDVERISLHETGCVNISYLPSEIGVEFTLSLNEKVLMDRKISARNPPPLCASIPYIHKLAGVCVRFHDLDFKNRHFSGCAALEVRLEGVVIEKFDLGCVTIPPKLRSHRKPRVMLN